MSRAQQRGIAARLMSVIVATAACCLPGGMPATAAALTDITGDVRAGHDVRLAGDAVVRLAGGTVTYAGVVSGQGSLTIAGSGRLVLTRDSDFTLPPSRQRQRLVTFNGNHPITRLDDPDLPAIIVEPGATLQYGDGSGTTGQFAHYVPRPGGAWNMLNIRVDGTLDMALHSRVHLGAMSGAGLIDTRRDTWPGVQLAGPHTFAGVYVNGTGFDFGAVDYTTSAPGLKTIVNYGSAIHSAADGQTTLDPADIYSKAYGSDVNYHTWGSGVVRNTGVYSWSDNASLERPTLSDPALDYATVPHSANKRGVNLEGATVEWGDGTTNRFFLPGNADTAYINLHFDGRDRSRLTLNYNGPVTLGTPISGGVYHDTMAAPGQGDVVIAGTPGNAVTFAAPQNYDGSTTIGRGASLRLGDGTAKGDSGLMRGDRYQIIDNGELIVQNTAKPVTLAKISGPGAFTQAGAAAVTLTGALTYTGATTVRQGTLAVTGGSLAASSGVALTGPAARLDLAAGQTVPNLAGTAGTLTFTGSVTLAASASTTFGGQIVGDPHARLVKTGSGTLALTARSRTPGGSWTIRQGALNLASGATTIQSGVSVAAGAALTGAGTVEGTLTNTGAVTPSALTVTGDYVQKPNATLAAAGLIVHGRVTLAGALTAPPSGGTTTVIDNRGTAPVTGTFANLPEGAKVGARVLTYTGGDGNDVVLTAPAGTAPAASGALTRVADGAALTAALHHPATRWTAAAAAAALTAALALVAWRTRRRHGTHRAPS